MDEFRELPFASLAVAISTWLLVPSAIGAAWAGISGRRRLAYVCLAFATIAVVAPIAIGMIELGALD